jgi:hypothetical protein
MGPPVREWRMNMRRLAHASAPSCGDLAGYAPVTMLGAPRAPTIRTERHGAAGVVAHRNVSSDATVAACVNA